ncbi:MAG: ATP synthase F0 subunit C [Candidatus Aminicenantes bacterium]|nr:ATP synthase F0 subunit C [Candidatus Aminicenantes bacterium]
MSKTAKTLGRLFVFALFGAAPLLAQQAQPLTDARASLFKLSLIVGGGIITLAVMAGAYCQSRAISSACEGISRNPGGAPTIRALLLFGLVLIETLVIYALFIVIVILMIQWGNY